MRKYSQRLIAILTAVAALAHLPARAQFTWDGGADPDGNWANGLNWVGDVAPTAASTFNFDGSVNLNAVNNITLTAADSTLNFNAGAAAFTLSGSAIRGGAINNNSAVMQTININMRLNGGRTINVGSSGITLGVMATSTGTSGRTWTKTGAGDLILRGNSTGTRIDYAVNNGRMIFDTSSGQTTSLAGGGAGTGNIALASGTELRLDHVGNVTFGTATANSGSTIRLNNAGTLTANLTVNSGASLIGNGNFTGTGSVLGTIAPGFSIGTIGSSGNLTFAASTIANFELDRSAAQNVDFLNVGGVLTLDGILNLANIGGALQLGDTFDLFAATSLAGPGWTLVTLPSLDPELAWDTALLNTSGIISVVGVPEPSTLAVTGLSLLLLAARRRN